MIRRSSFPGFASAGLVLPWLTVPKEVVLPTDYGNDGRSHLCENLGYIYCFTPGQVRG